MTVFENEFGVYSTLEGAIKTCPDHVTFITEYPACPSVEKWEEDEAEGWNCFELYGSGTPWPKRHLKSDWKGGE